MDSAIIEVGLGLVMVYFILSIVVTTANNLIVNSLGLRAANLRAWFHSDIIDQPLRDQLLLKLGIVTAQPATQSMNIFKRLTTWVRTFLIDILVPGAGDFSATTDVSSVMPAVFADMLVGTLIQNEGDKVAALSDTDKLKAIGEVAKTSVADSSLSPILETAASFDDARTKVAAWFDNDMTQLTNRFKRRVQLIGFISGLIVCLVLNVDTLYLARTLWNDPAMRQTVAQAASNAASNTASATAQGADTLSNELQPLLDLRLPIGWVITPVVSCSTDDIKAGTCTPTAESVAETAQSSLRNLANFLPWNNAWGGWLNFVLYKLVGWILTTFAIMQGSDFWFNLLGRLTAAKTNLAKVSDAISGGQAPSS